jgi:iron complex transport system permease protein
MVLSLGVGAVELSPASAWTALFHRTDRAADPIIVTIIWELRLPRMFLAALIGAGLASAGAALQGLFRNPLADPFVVGASGGAALGATLAITSGLQVAGAGFGPVPMAAFAGALLAVAVVYGVAEVGGTASPVTLLLAGAALSTLLTAIVSFVMIVSDKNLHETFSWLLGGLAGRGWPHLAASGPYLVASVIGLWLLARPLDALASGEETAHSLGLRMAYASGAVVAVASLATAAAVAAGGIIGFVGLIAPHMARMLVGANHSQLIPASALLGALLMLLADDVARTAMAPLELPVGIVTALLGAPFFLFLLKSRQAELGGG